MLGGEIKTVMLKYEEYVANKIPLPITGVLLVKSLPIYVHNTAIYM